MDKGIILKNSKLEVATIGENGITEKDILVHDCTTHDTSIHSMLGRMMPPNFPAVLGVIRKVENSTFDSNLISQLEYEKKNARYKNVNELLNSGETWEV